MLPKENNLQENKISIKKILKQYRVKSENDLQDKLMGEGWNMIRCKICENNYDLITCNYKNSNPVCPCCGGF